MDRETETSGKEWQGIATGDRGTRPVSLLFPVRYPQSLSGSIGKHREPSGTINS